MNLKTAKYKCLCGSWAKMTYSFVAFERWQVVCPKCGRKGPMSWINIERAASDWFQALEKECKEMSPRRASGVLECKPPAFCPVAASSGCLSKAIESKCITQSTKQQPIGCSVKCRCPYV